MTIGEIKNKNKNKKYSENILINTKYISNHLTSFFLLQNTCSIVKL